MSGAAPDQTKHIDSQTLFEKLFASAPDAVIVVDGRGRITEANPQVEHLFGYSCSELLGSPVEILVPERFRSAHPGYRSEYAQEPRMRPMGAGLELYGRRKDGSEFPVDILLSPVETSEGPMVLGVIRDITERKLRDDALRLSRAMFEQLFESLPDAIVETNQRGAIVRVNSRVEEMFGYDRDELVGQPVNLLVPERFRSAHLAHQQTYLASPHTRPMGAGIELYGRRKDGSEFPVDIMLNSLEVEGERLALAVVRDITERKRADEALRLSEERFRLVVDSVKDHAMMMLDRDGRVASWNPGAERIQGYRAEEILGQHFSRFYTQEDVDRGKPEYGLKMAAAQGRFEDEGWRVRKDGSRFWANVVTTAIKDANGQVSAYAKIARDFTDRKKSEDALLLELSSALLSSLDIRNLLSAIASSIRQVVAHDHAALALHDSRTGKFQMHVLTGESAQFSRKEDAILSLDHSAYGLVFTNREPLLMNSFDSAALPPAAFRDLVAAGMKSACWVPLVSRERLLGALRVASRREGGFTLQNLAMLRQASGQIAVAIDNALAFRQISELNQRLVQEKRYLEEELNTEHRFEEIIGDSAGLKRVLTQVETVAGTDATVLILGETGTGKELIARAIHQLSGRRERSLVKLNCAAIPSGLLESELFGHEKGAFTGAISQKVGRLELAHQGTLFLDEIGDLPLELQPKILRALQEKEIERLGGSRTIPVNVRLIAATNRNLEQMVADKQFRSDLFYRLKVFPISLPPLRERREDIPLLVRYFVDRHARRMDRRIADIPEQVMQALVRWQWPGNIRELENFLERAVILSKGPTLRAPLSELMVAAESGPEQERSLESAERDHILRALRDARGLIGGPDGAAARLGLKRTTLNSKMKKLGIERNDYA